MDLDMSLCILKCQIVLRAIYVTDVGSNVPGMSVTLVS
jgi:hypothetical protein